MIRAGTDADTSDPCSGESGFLNWAGGSGTCHNRPETGLFALCPSVCHASIKSGEPC